MNNFHMREGKVEFRWKRWRNKKRQEVSSCLMVLFSGAVLLGAGGVALAGPTGGQVTGGQGTITNPNGTTTNINQTSNVLSINWQDFSIAAGETVNFYQPGSTSVAINRVVGGVPSYLAGALNANGRVFILNSAGITFTGTSQVNVGALLATTAMTVNGDPTQAASYSGSGYGAVINQGSISVSNGGFAILAAPYVQNTGFIKADLGTIALAGTNQFTLDLSGTGLINFVVPAGAVEKIVSDGKAVGVDNAGTLQARSGQVLISANVASEVVNAVVNLNGIVDADAFAANGQGGSVLVTAAGDINVGGQVTAKGSGAGNGGQIVTKAGSNDAIGQLAFVSAAGGATGKGGFVEISGKQVGLQGAIDPGSGGSLYIDPTNIHVVAANNAPLIGSAIGTDFIENQLQHTVNVNLAADHNVFFDALADDHQLVGGNGNLTITAGLTAPGNITFGHSANGANPGTNDAIVQGHGFIHMNANGGNIGSSAHAITLVTGVNNTTAGVGVTQAGDIVLAAGNDITVKKIQIKSSGGSSFTAKFAANAGHNFTAIGDINVTANAHGSGHEQATASVNIVAHNNINVHNIAVVALADKTSGNSSQDAAAQANLLLNAQGSSVAARNLLVSASAFNAGRGEANGGAFGNIQASKNIDVNGSIHVAGAAVTDHVPGSSAMGNGHLLLNAVTGHVNVAKDVIVSALAKAPNSQTHATASANINAATNVTIHGNVSLKATASGSNTHALADFAFANLLVHAGSDISVGRSITVAARAHGFGTGEGPGPANASAQASANFTANHIDINGNVAVSANAVQTGDNDASSGANALANLLMHANTGHVDVNGNVTVEAFAQQGGSSVATANALANVLANTDIALGGIEVKASGDNLGSAVSGAQAAANLVMQAVNGNITVVHDIVVGAVADSGGTGSAQANAVANVVANVGITVGGNADVSATANQHGSSGHDGAANANLTMDAVTGNISVGGIAGAHAVAQASGSSTAAAQANASANILAQIDVDLGGASVTASARETASSQANPANANANLQIQAITGHVNVSGDIQVTAFAQQSASDQASAFAQANVNAHTFINVNGNVEVTASANNVGSDASSALACASLQMVTGTGHIAVNHDIIVHAFAKESGSTSAVATANALANIQANTDITVGGNVDVTATANADNSDASNANALANLTMLANHGNLTVDHDIVVGAVADSQGTGKASANAVANIQANVDINVGGNADVSATANQHGSSGSDASANANLTMDAVTGNISVGGIAGAHAIAQASGSSTAGAHAKASANVHAQNNVDLGGADVTANAKETASSQADAAIANANLLVEAVTGHVNVSGDIQVAAYAQQHASDQASAFAQANVNAHTFINVNGNVGVTASANNPGSGASSSALACASLQMVTGTGHIAVNHDIIVHAFAKESGSTSAVATANAQANIQAATDITVGGNVDVTATANANNSDASNANALANLVMNAVGGTLHINHGVMVNAIAHDGGAGSPRAHASANLFGNVDVIVGNNVAVLASVDHDSGTQGARASANLQVLANTRNVSLGGIDVKAIAHSGGSSSAHANALANVVAHSNLAIGGNITVSASADQTGSDGTTAFANANLQLHAVNGSINMAGNLDVVANAHGAGDGAPDSAAANALANIVANTNIHIGGVASVSASADQTASSGTPAGVRASANLQVDAIHGSANLGGINVRAVAIQNNDSSARAGALANVLGNTNIHITNNAVVFASASQHGSGGSSAQACANLQLDAVTGSVNIGHNVLVQANALDSGASFARANASANILGHTNVVIAGNVDVIGTALDNVSGGTQFAEACANLQIQAATGSINIGGDVGAYANAVEDAHGFAQANATVNMLANNGITVGGSVEATATAHQESAGGSWARASANIILDAAHGDVNVTKDVHASANAVNVGSESAIADALINANAVAGDVLINGVVTANAHAVASSHHSQNGALALSSINVHGDPVVLGGLAGHASAYSHGTDFANALMNVHVNGAAVTIHGVSALFANAIDANVHGDGAQAVANVVVHASGGGSGDLRIDNAFNVTASANDHASNDHANALATVNLTGMADNSSAIVVNDINVRANALDANGNGLTLADAELLIAASSAGGGVRLLHNVHVNATADEVLGTPAAHAHAIGNAFINAGRVVDGSGNDIFVFANAVDGSSANALATLHVTANHIDIGDSGKIGAQAVAKAIHNNDQAHALANVDITADTGNASVHGNLEGIASASFTTPGATVLNNITASALVHVTANHNIHLEDINVTADAENWGNNTAHAVASLNVQAHNSINLDGRILVNALAHDHNSHGNGSPYAAVALANVFFNGTVVTTVHNTSNSVDLRAHAIDDGHNAAQAIANLTFGTGVKSVLLGGITLDVLAHDTDTLAGGVGALASANLIQTNPAVEFNVGTHGINLQADASSQGTAQAHAKALLQLHENTFLDSGGITVNAQAKGGALTHNAILATASVDLMAKFMAVEGAIDVKANAHNLGVNSHAVALANAAIVGTGSLVAVTLNDDITVEAYAFDSNAKGKATLANAQLLIEDLGVNGEIITHDVTVIGSADQAGGSGAGAKAVGLANVDLEATLGLGVDGGVAALAFAHDPHGTNATASANVHVNANQVLITGTGHHVFHVPGSAGTLATATASYGILAVAAAVYSGSSVAAGHGAHALANVAVNAQNEALILHGVEMLALALDEGGATANANAHLAIHGNNGSVGIGFGHLEVRVPGSHGSTQASLGLFAGVFVGAVAVDTAAPGHAHANALTQINAANSVVIQAGVMQLAVAVDTDGNSARATADLEIAAGKNVFINQGEIDLFLSDQLASSLSHSLGSSVLSNLLPGGGLAGHHSTGFAVFDGAVAFDGGSGTTHHANALASVNIDPAVVEIDGPVLVAAVAIDNSGSGASANAVLNIHGNQVGIGTESGHGDVAVLAVAAENGNLDGNAKATANATITASNAGSAISLNGVTVAAAAFDHDATGSLDDLANAQLLISATGNGDIRTGSLNVFALASAEGTNLIGDANALANATVMTNGNVTIDGDVSVVANALASTGAGDANAVALLTLKANHFLDVHGHIGVAADATAHGSSPASAQATATANIRAGRVTVDSGIDVTAAADETNSDGGDARACANLAMSASTGTLAVNGHLRVSADATTEGSKGTAVANATANLHANNGDIFLTGNVDVDATAIASESTGGGASACANLKIIASSGTVEIHGNVMVNAFADHDGTGSARADADALIWANTKPGGHGGDVKIFGNIGMKATAEGSSSGTSTAANVSLNIVASSGNVFVGGGIFLRASALGSGHSPTVANLAATINARHGVVIGGDIIATASAEQFTGDTNVGANAVVAVKAGNDISMHGARVRARAVQDSSSTGATANAMAELALVAGGNISVGTNGLLVQAGAEADSAGPASANALLSLDAGTQGVGGIFVQGNVIATAKAIGSATSNLAHANVHLAAGGANEFSTGAPSNFGNIVVIGQIGAFAYADPATNDKATASVEIFAHNNILIVGNDPIASAKVGPSGGTLFAFRQSHVSTQFSSTGADGQHVLADIDIRAGGSITVVPASSLEHVLKLYAMPTDAPTLNSSGGLTIIPLWVDGQDCGVLGLAGADPNMVAKGQACKRKPINVSDLTDTGP